MSTDDTPPAQPMPGGAPPHAAPRVALVLGAVGALGEELLAALVASPRYRAVYVTLKHAIGSATAKYRPWVPGSIAIVADDAYVCVTDAQAVVPKASPMRLVGTDTLVDAARIARDAGVRRLVVVAPLSALLQLNAASQSLSSEQELALLDMRFETLVIVRPTRGDSAADTGGWIARVVQAMARSVLQIMLPSQVQALHPRMAAAAILDTVQSLPPGVHVVGARELLATVERSMPAIAPRRARLR